MAVDHLLAVVPVADLAAVRERGIAPGEAQEAIKGVRLAAVTDPDGNAITFIGGFRPDY